MSGLARLPLRSPEDFGYEVARLRGKGEWEPAKVAVESAR
jgi:hypothetical protein